MHRHLVAAVRPDVPGQGDFAGRQLHAAEYTGPQEYAGRRVVVVGGGNSAAQVLAEVSAVASTTWVTQRPPKFLPDDVDGRALFMVATARRRALESGGPDTGGVAALGDIVMVPVVREARERGALRAEPMFERVTRDGVAWADGREQAADAIIWCTGFRPELRHLAPLGLRYADGHLAVLGTQAVDEPRLHLVGYGDWTGPASATLIGVGRTARDLVASSSQGGRRSRRGLVGGVRQGLRAACLPPSRRTITPTRISRTAAASRTSSGSPTSSQPMARATTGGM